MTYNRELFKETFDEMDYFGQIEQNFNQLVDVYQYKQYIKKVLILMGLLAIIIFYRKHMDLYFYTIAMLAISSLIFFISMKSTITIMKYRLFKISGVICSIISILFGINTIVFASNQSLIEQIKEARPEYFESNPNATIEDFKMTYDEAYNKAEEYFSHLDDEYWIRDERFGGWVSGNANSHYEVYDQDGNLLEQITFGNSNKAMTKEEAKQVMIDEYMSGKWATYPEG